MSLLSDCDSFSFLHQDTTAAVALIMSSQFWRLWGTADVLIKSQSVCLKWDEKGDRMSAFNVIILQISY